MLPSYIYIYIYIERERERERERGCKLFVELDGLTRKEREQKRIEFLRAVEAGELISPERKWNNNEGPHSHLAAKTQTP
jgi:hypothetical protein